jgi:hypothetical protein
MNVEYTQSRAVSPIARHQDIIQRKTINELNTCNAPECHEKRNGVGRYCIAHRNRLRETGHAWHPRPVKTQVQRMEKVIARFVAWLSERDRKLHDGLLHRYAGILSKPFTMAILPQRNYTQRCKADIVLGWSSKLGVDLNALIVRRAALALWAEACYVGQRKDLNRFLNTQAGCWLTTRADARRVIQSIIFEHAIIHGQSTILKIPKPEIMRFTSSGTVRAEIGKRSQQAVREVFGVQWITPDLLHQAIQGMG